MRKFKAIFAGGGTGGHLTPALAIANNLKAKIGNKAEADFLFIGTRRGIEFKVREKLGYPLALINIRGLSRSLSLSNLMFPFLLIGAVLKSMSIIGSFKPDIVIGTGGYVMGPVLLAAYFKGVNRVLQEQNSYPGLTTRRLAPLTDRVFLGFHDAVGYLSEKCRVIDSGNPVNELVGSVPKEEGLRYFEFDHSKKTIMIMGGSQGASNINKNILRNLDGLDEKYQLIWQTGDRDYKDVTASAGGRVSGRSLFPFTDRIELAYAAADIIIARAGALSLAEIAAAGLPSILIPFPFATGDHQMKNAESFARNGAAVIIRDNDLERIDLLGKAVELIQTDNLEVMSRAAGENHLINGKRAVDIICDEILELTEFDKE